MDQEMLISRCNDYDIIQYLGHGQYAIVKLGRKGEEEVAFKFLNVQNEAEKPRILEKLRQEVSILQQLNHPRIIKLKKHSENLEYMKKNGQIVHKIGMILELGKKGNLFSYLIVKQRFDEQISRFYFKQLMSTLVYLKSLNISHLDFKPENIVLDQDFNLKLTGFRFSKQTEGLINDFFGGSEPYMAPEIWNKIAYDGSKVDIFAAGQILFTMITGYYAFRNHRNEPYNWIIENDFTKFWNYQNNQYKILFPQGFSEDFKDLINRMFDPDFNTRITPEDCLQHPWTKGVEAKLVQIQEQFINIDRQIEQYNEKEKQKHREKKAEQKAEQGMLNYLQNNQYK